MPTHCPCFQLALGHRFQRRADSLGTVSTLVDGKHQHRRRERLDEDADARQAVEHYKQLHQDGRTADDPDVQAGQLGKYRHLGKLHQRHRHGDDKRNRKGQRRQRDGDGNARDQDLKKGIRQYLGKAFCHDGDVPSLGFYFLLF